MGYLEVPVIRLPIEANHPAALKLGIDLGALRATPNEYGLALSPQPIGS
jgi:hypothetical protein